MANIIILFIFINIFILMLVSRKLARFSYKNLYLTDIGNISYNSKMFNNKCVFGGVVPKPILSYFYIFSCNYIIKNKIIHNKKLNNVERILYESYNFIKRNYNINVNIFNNLLYINDFCRVILFSRAVLTENKYKLNKKIIDSSFNTYNFSFTYLEILAIKTAFLYELIGEIGKISKFIILNNKLLRKAKDKNFNSKYKNSICYLYYYGINTDDFENFENIIKSDYQNFDKIISKYFDINNKKIKHFLNVLESIKFINNYDFDSYYFGYKIIKTDCVLSCYNVEKIKVIFYKISMLSFNLKLQENYVLDKVIEYSKFLDKDIDIIIENDYKNLVKFVSKNVSSKSRKKKTLNTENINICSYENINNYTNKFININYFDKSNINQVYFKNSYISVYDKFECNIIYEDVSLFIMPLIKVKNEYLSLKNLFNFNFDNGLKCYNSLFKIDFNYLFQNFDDNFYLSFNFNCKNDYSFNFLIAIYLKDFTIKLINKVSKNKFIYQITKCDRSFYLLLDSVTMVYFNKLLFGKKINKVLFDNVLYLNFLVKSNEKYIQLLIFNKLSSLKKYLYLGDCIDEKPQLDISISSSVAMFDNVADDLIKNAYNALYKSKHFDNNYNFSFMFMLKHDKNLINEANFSNKIMLLHAYLVMLIYHNQNYSEIISRLVFEVNNMLKTLNTADILYLVDIYYDILLVNNINNELIKLGNNIFNVLNKFDYLLIYNELKNKFNLQNVLLLAKCKDFLPIDLKNNLSKYIINLGLFDIDFENKALFYNVLYYLYDDYSKQLIYKKLISDNDILVEKLAIITDKIIGIDIKNDIMSINPNLCSNLDKLVINFSKDKSYVTVIIKKSADYFSVNDVVFENKKLIRLKDGYCKIVCSYN